MIRELKDLMSNNPMMKNNMKGFNKSTNKPLKVKMEKVDIKVNKMAGKRNN